MDFSFIPSFFRWLTRTPKEEVKVVLNHTRALERKDPFRPISLDDDDWREQIASIYQDDGGEA